MFGRCDLCGHYVGDAQYIDANKRIYEGVITATPEGGDIRHHKNKNECFVDDFDIAFNARKSEIDSWIQGQKAKELARLQAEYGGLKTELTKPVYTGMTDNEILDHLNNIDNGNTKEDPLIAVEALKEAIDPTELISLTAAQKATLSVYSGGYIDISNDNVKTILDSIFPMITKSRTAIEALRIKKQSIIQNLGFKIVRIEQEHLKRTRLL